MNEFPESLEKSHLRHIHLKAIASRSQVLGRPLAYLGLPSAEMLDVRLWKPYLRQITAIERDPDMATQMYRTAMMQGIRGKLLVIEKDLYEAARLLAMDDRSADLSVSTLYGADRESIRLARNVSYDIINLDLYGGFLYPSSANREDKNTQILRDLISYQARHQAGFILLLTFNLRDSGRDDYLDFISDAMRQLSAANVDISEINRFYTSNKKVNDQPPNLIRMRFCVPAFIHKTAFEHFEVRIQGAWTYKTFYCASLLFEPRKGGGSLGLSWPPIDEFKRLLAAPLFRLSADSTVNDFDHVQSAELLAPTLG
jgi:hypothetical protein